MLLPYSSVLLILALLAGGYAYLRMRRKYKGAIDALESIRVSQADTKQHLSDQEEILSMIYHSSSELIGLLAVEAPGEYTITSLNRAYLKALEEHNLSIAQESLIGLTLEEFCLQVLQNSEETTGRIKKRYGEVIETLQPVQYESVAHLVNGDKLVLEVTLSPILNAEGKCTHIVDITRDVTSRKLAEDSLKKANRMLSTLISNLPGVVYRCRNDEQWSVEFLSSGFKEMTGYEPELFYDTNMGVSWTKITVEEDRARTFEAIDQAFKNKEPYQITYRIKQASGRERWIWEQGREVFDDDGGEVMWREGFMLDITDLKRAQERLVKALKERQNFIRQHNKMLEQQVKQRTLELEEKSIALEDLNKALQQKNEELRVSEEELRQNGEELHASNDFLIKTQKALDEQNKELQKTLNQLKNAQTQLVQSEKMATLGQLTAGIAHEINNPVNYISAGIEGLKVALEDFIELLNVYDSLNSDNSEEKLKEIEKLKVELDYDILVSGVEELIRNISTGASRTAEIVRELRTFARLDEANLKMIDLHQSIDSTLVMLRNQYKDRIVIEKIYEHIPPIECYPGKLNQVLMNLLVNAVQAIKEEGTITIRTHLCPPDEKGNEQICVCISDTGTGIPSQIKDKIFEPFFTSKDVGEGTGLGLPISLSIVQTHGGQLIVESEEGKGTTFKVILPTEQPPQENTQVN